MDVSDKGARRVRMLVLVACVGALAGCVVAPRGYESSDVPGVKIIAVAEARANKLTSEPFTLAIAAGSDGTELVLSYLEAARARGAIAVSGLQIDMATTIEGEPGVCTTHIGPKEEVTVQNEVVSTSGRYEQRMVMKPVSRFVTELEYRCKPVSQYVTRYESVQEQTYDYMTHQYRTQSRMKPVSRYETKTECGSESVSHYVTRYEYQWERTWIPPKWEIISRRYSRWDLIEGEPICTRPDPAGDATLGAEVDAIRGTLHRLAH